ncbi:MAG TPA: hypothetical protein VFE62_10385 [Gemmataceae bacterium]|nr:hypothetical protein [Gemmataceae bacterium]
MQSHDFSSKPSREIHALVLDHLVRTVSATRAETRPFGHAYFENILPEPIYAAILRSLPDSSKYATAAERHYRGEAGSFNRMQFALTTAAIDQLPVQCRELWRGVAAALTDPALKHAVFTTLAPDLAYRYGVAEDRAPLLDGFTRPTLYRETEGFEIPPHPDTRKKIVTMHFYLPADHTQLELGTALYRRRVLALPFGSWQNRFEKVRQFAFQPNSAYAFVVNNTLRRKSWHGREKLPEGAGVRNTLLNTFYSETRDGFSGYHADRVAERAA